MKLIHRHNEQIEEIQKLTSELEKSPAFRKMREDQAAETLKMRMAAAEKIEDLRKEQGEIIPKLQKDLATKEEKYNKAKVAMDAAMDVAKKAKVAVMSKSHTLESAIGRQRELLFSTCDPAIDESVRYFNEQLDFLRSPGRISSQKMGALRNLFTMKKATTEESNLEAVNSALVFCQSCIKALNEMKLEPGVDTGRIEKMKGAIPDIGVFSEYSGEKPMEKVNADPFSILPSDGALEYSKSKLLKKAEQILKR